MVLAACGPQGGEGQFWVFVVPLLAVTLGIREALRAGHVMATPVLSRSMSREAGSPQGTVGGGHYIHVLGPTAFFLWWNLRMSERLRRPASWNQQPPTPSRVGTAPDHQQNERLGMGSALSQDPLCSPHRTGSLAEPSAHGLPIPLLPLLPSRPTWAGKESQAAGAVTLRPSS